MIATPHPSRDSVTTIRADGGRQFLYPADVRGPISRARRVSGLVLIAIYALLPWIPVRGYPAVFLDVAHRRFHLFGLTLAAQDLWLLFFLITGLGFTLFIVTALFGRLWCGWACPQTVFLDHAFRRIERWCEGDSIARRQLAAAPLSGEKILRVGAKHAGYVVLSLFVTHLFLSYFVSLPAVWQMVRQSPGQHPGVFLFIAAATGIIYFNFAWFREQLCIILCPYGRLQSVLTDDHTVIVGYDTSRGEPRGRSSSGDCLDCDRCVAVCPTGIDIRQGLQLECIGCAACIDACNTVMTRANRPTGLIRYDSMAGFGRKPRRWWRPRLALYAVLLVGGCVAFGLSALRIHPVLLGVTRLVGAPYYVDGATVRDQFLVRLTNKQDRPILLQVEVANLPAGADVRGLDREIEIPAMGEEVRPVIVEEPLAAFRGSFTCALRVSADGKEVAHGAIPFLGPQPIAP